MAPSLSLIEREPAQESQAVMSNNNSNNRDEVPPGAASAREQRVNPSTDNGPDQHANDDAQHNTSPSPSGVQDETQVATADRRSTAGATATAASHGVQDETQVATADRRSTAGATATAASQSGQEGRPQHLNDLLLLLHERWEAEVAQNARRQEETRAELDAQRREARAENDALRQDNDRKHQRQFQAVQALAHNHFLLQEELQEMKEKVNEQEKMKTAVEEAIIRLSKENESTKAKVKRVKREQVKKEREEGKPKRPLNEANCYAQDVGRKWREMSEEERESLYGDKVRQARERYDQAMKDYNERKKSQPVFEMERVVEEEKMRYNDLVAQDKERFLEESKKWEEIKESKLSLDERKPAAKPSPQEPGHEELAATTEVDDPEDPTTAARGPQVDPKLIEYWKESGRQRLAISRGLAQGGIAATATEPAQAAGLPRESSSTGAHESAASNLTRNDTSAVTDDRSMRAEINHEVNRAGSACAAEPPQESNQEVATSVAAAAAAVNPDEDGNDQLSSPSASETNKEGGKRKRDHELLPRWYGITIVYELKGYSDPDGKVLEAGNVWIKSDSTREIIQVKRNDLDDLDLVGKPASRNRRPPRQNLLSGESVSFNVGDMFRCELPPSISRSSTRVRCWAKVTKVTADESGDVNSPNSKRHCHYIVDGRKISESTLSLKSIRKRKV